MVSLQILNGPQTGHRVFLRQQQRLSFGRTQYADVAVPHDAMISQVHFRVRIPDKETCEIEDLGSTNGTFVNGKKVLYSRAKDGDLITAGATVMRIGTHG